jgi:folate-binding protein YgfZ
MQLHVFKDRCLLKFCDDGCLKFLNEISTNVLKPDVVSYSCLLSSKGRFLCDFFVVPHKDNKDFVYIDIAKNFVALFTKKINLYDIDEKFSIEILDNSLCCFSPTKIDERFLPDPRRQDYGFRAYLSKEELDKLVFSSFDYELYRLKSLVPEGHSDMIVDKSIILNFGFDNLNAISFTKGCYPGQELMARTKHQGMIRYSLALLQTKGALNIDKFSEVDFKTIASSVLSVKNNSNKDLDFNEETLVTILSCCKNFALVLIKE